MTSSDETTQKETGLKDKIGQLLLKHTALTEEQLAEALEIQRESGLLIGEILLKKNYIRTHDITKVICHQINIPYLTELKIEDIDHHIIKDIPINYAKAQEILPSWKRIIPSVWPWFLLLIPMPLTICRKFLKNRFKLLSVLL